MPSLDTKTLALKKNVQVKWLCRIAIEVLQQGFRYDGFDRLAIYQQRRNTRWDWLSSHGEYVLGG